MRIAFVNQPWSVVRPAAGGHDSISIWILAVARLLARAADIVCYSRTAPGLARTEHYDAVEHRRIPVAIDRVTRPLRILDRWRVLNPRRPFFASRLFYLQYGLLVARDLRTHACDVVHIMNFSQFVPLIRALNPKIKIVLHMQCEWLSQLDPGMIEPRLRQVDLVIGCSEHVTRRVREAFPSLSDRCRTVYNGVDPDRFFPAKTDPTATRGRTGRVLFVGLVSPHKGVHVLLEAFQQVLDRLPEAQLQIVGWNFVLPREFMGPLDDDATVAVLAPHLKDASYPARLRELVRRSPALAGRVSFTGSVSHLDMPARYRDADVVTVPSVWHEPFGMPVAEAMSTGVPVVATRSGGIVEQVEDGKTGLLVERGDAKALANALVRLLSDDDLRARMGKAAGQRAAEHFSWDRIANRVWSEYQSLTT